MSQTLFTNENAPSSNCKRNLSKEQTLSMLPELECIKFSGVKSSKFEFKNFLAQFHNCLTQLESNEVKLTSLKSYLFDYALQLISHLKLESCYYSVAINLLKREFLNENLITNAIFNQILSYKPKYYQEYFSISQFLAEFRADLAELKGSYDLDYFEGLSAGNKLRSHLIFEKLSSQLKREIIRKLGRNYPTLNDIFESYSEAIRILLLSKFPQEKTEQFSNRRDNK